MQTPYAARQLLRDCKFLKDVPPPPGHEPKFVYLLARHGSRYPTARKLRSLELLPGVFKVHSHHACASALLHETCRPCAKGINALASKNPQAVPACCGKCNRCVQMCDVTHTAHDVPMKLCVRRAVAEVHHLPVEADAVLCGAEQWPAVRHTACTMFSLCLSALPECIGGSSMPGQAPVSQACMDVVQSPLCVNRPAHAGSSSCAALALDSQLDSTLPRHGRHPLRGDPCHR